MKISVYLIMHFNTFPAPSCVALKNGRQVLIKRARHVITETNRTQEAAEALKRRDFIKVH